MNMPGFTAEASLYQTNEPYRHFGTSNQTKRSIHMAYNSCVKQCVDNFCDDQTTDPSCYKECVRTCYGTL